MSKKEKDLIGKYRTVTNWASGIGFIGGSAVSVLFPPLAPVAGSIAVASGVDLLAGNEIQESLLRKGKDVMTISKKEKNRGAVTTDFRPATDKKKAVYYNPKGATPV